MEIPESLERAHVVGLAELLSLISLSGDLLVVVLFRGHWSFPRV